MKSRLLMFAFLFKSLSTSAVFANTAVKKTDLHFYSFSAVLNYLYELSCKF